MLFMGTITLNVDDAAEQKFRKAATIAFGSGKGSLGRAATHALEKWADRELGGGEARMLVLLEKGFKMGKLKYRDRAELHER